MTAPAKHTPEPWRVGTEFDGCVPLHSRRWGEFATFVVVVDRKPLAEGMANAERAVACVNACAGLGPEKIAGLVAAAEQADKALTLALENLPATLAREVEHHRYTLRAALSALRGDK